MLYIALIANKLLTLDCGLCQTANTNCILPTVSNNKSMIDYILEINMHPYKKQVLLYYLSAYKDAFNLHSLTFNPLYFILFFH